MTNHTTKSKPIKLIITGYARHGKDTVCESIVNIMGWSFESSSHILLNEVIYPVLQPKYGYSSPDEAFDDRVNHREEWFNLLKEYNTPDASKLGTLIFSKHNIYCGLRNRDELLAMKEKGLYDSLVWVDAASRLPPEPATSMTIHASDADYIIDNNNTLLNLQHNIYKFVHGVLK